MLNVILRELRISKKLTLKDVYSETGISDSRLYRFEKGKTQSLSLDELGKLAKLFGVSFEYLLYRSGYIKNQTCLFENTEQLNENEIRHIQNEIDMIVALKGMKA